MVEEASLGVSRELSALTGMSGGQFGILTILIEAPRHSMRQQELADAMRWDRTRLSHQLTRMRDRDWINREKEGRGITLVVLTDKGCRAQHLAAPMLGKIVRARFFSRLTQAQLDAVAEIRTALSTAI